MKHKEDIGPMPSETRVMVLKKVRQSTGETALKHKAAVYSNPDGSVNIEKLTKNIIANYRLAKYRNQVTEFIKYIFESDKLVEQVLFPKSPEVK